MYRDIALSASLMCIDWLRAGPQWKEVEAAGVDFLHLDVVDGLFERDFTMGSAIINTFREHCTVPSDYHLMVEDPARLFETFRFGSADYFTIHQESCRNLHRDLVRLRRMGAKVGVALCPGTPLESLEYVIEDADMILLLAVDPGYKGQPLVGQVLRKIEAAKVMIDRLQLQVRISVDGSVNPLTIPKMVAAGADMLVLGSSGLFRKDLSIADAMQQVRLAIDQGLELRDGTGSKRKKA